MPTTMSSQGSSLLLSYGTGRYVPVHGINDYSVYLPKTEGADLDKEEHPVMKIEKSAQSYVINSGSNQMN